MFQIYNGQNIFREYINGDPIAFLLASAQELHIDATFKSRSAQPINNQLLIVMARYMDRVTA